ncbi:MAG: ABC-F family ATP-binding cassette domain-containing protein [Candidatus Zixiibacteriota bacterium]
MTLLAAEYISKKFKDQVLMGRVSFTVQDSDRIGLVGKNGSGKTTLLEILAAKQEPDSGVITRSRACRIDYVEQEKTEYLDQTLHEFVSAARQDLLDMQREIRELEQHLAHFPHDGESLTRLGTIQHTFESARGHLFENEVRIILEGLGFAPVRHHDPLRNLSGGEKNRAGLARLLAGNGNLLLLDEPTNHLDIESTTWLENYLKQLNKAYIIVSHDRTFLTTTVDRVWEVGFGTLEFYYNGFERYLSERHERRAQQAHKYAYQQEEIKRLEEFVRRNMAGQKTKQAQSKLKYLARIKRIEAPRSDGRGPLIKVSSSGRSFNHVLAADSISLGYGSRTVVEDITFDLYRGDKVGLIGRNGSGKSTILKALLGELEPMAGTLRLGSNVDVAYFDQELSDLNYEATVLDNLWELDPSAEVGKIRSALARFGFTGEDVLKAVAALSGGEKTKLCLARLLYRPANFVILDEPTNHLDIDAREALETALGNYDGTCLIVSHDRFFLDRVTSRILHVNDGSVTPYNGNYSYFAEKTKPIEPAAAPKTKDSSKKRAFDDFREQSKRKARHKKQLLSSKSKLADLEKELEQLESGIARDIPRHDWEALQRASERKKEVEKEILDLYAALEELEGMSFD